MTTFTVKVLNKVTGEPVPRALVFLIPGSPLADGSPSSSPRRTTPINGEVTFYDGPQILNSKTFDVIVLAAGYYPDSFAVRDFGMASVALQAQIESVEVQVKEAWEV